MSNASYQRAASDERRADNAFTKARSSPEHLARSKARQVLDLERRLAQARQELTDMLGANGRVTLDAGTFQAVPTGWRPNMKLTSFLLERRWLAACLVQRPVVSMPKVNELAAKKPELAAFITLQRAEAAQHLSLRFRAADEAEAADGTE